MNFEWDTDKADVNWAKHRVTFHEAATVFGDPAALTFYDEAHSVAEDRFLTIGTSDGNRVLLVSHTDRGDNTRKISVRVATTRERAVYTQQLR